MQGGDNASGMSNYCDISRTKAADLSRASSASIPCKATCRLASQRKSEYESCCGSFVRYSWSRANLQRRDINWLLVALLCCFGVLPFCGAWISASRLLCVQRFKGRWWFTIHITRLPHFSQDDRTTDATPGTTAKISDWLFVCAV